MARERAHLGEQLLRVAKQRVDRSGLPRRPGSRNAGRSLGRNRAMIGAVTTITCKRCGLSFETEATTNTRCRTLSGRRARASCDPESEWVGGL